jgi:hypothetical protein
MPGFFTKIWVMRLPKRRTMICLIAVVLFLAIVGWVWVDVLTTTGRQITQEKFDKIQKGMSLNEVNKIMESSPIGGLVNDINAITWRDGPNFIKVDLDHAKVIGKDIHLASFWETAQWYAKNCAKKVGINWN